MIFDDLTALFDGFAFVKRWILGVGFELKSGSKNESEKKKEKEGQFEELGSESSPKRDPKSSKILIENGSRKRMRKMHRPKERGPVRDSVSQGAGGGLGGGIRRVSEYRARI